MFRGVYLKISRKVSSLSSVPSDRPSSGIRIHSELSTYSLHRKRFFSCFHNGDWLVCLLSTLRPSLDAKPNNNIELRSSKVRRLNQLGTAQPFFSPSSAGNFAFGATLERL